MTDQQLQDELTQVRMLSALTYPALRRLTREGRLVKAREDQVIIGPGVGSTGFFVVIEGSVAVHLPHGPILAYLGPRQVFGEIALLEGRERTAFCRAYTECLLFEIPFGAFHSDLVANDVIRTGMEQTSRRRYSEQEAIRHGAPPPDLTPPAREELLDDEPEELLDDEEPPAEAGPARAPEPPRPPAIYATA